MTRLVISTLAGAALLLPATAAHAAPYPVGTPCRAAVAGVVGGPYHLRDDTDPGVVHTGSVRCTVQLSRVHSGADICSVTGPETFGVAWVAGPCPSSPGVTAICTEVQIAGGPTLYLDATSGGWTTDAGASCAVL